MKTLTILFVAAIMMGVGCSKSEDSENNPDKPDKPSPLPDLPDPNDVCSCMDDIIFMQYCYDNFDVNKDGKVSKIEASAVAKIDLARQEIKTLTGIGYFSNLEILNCKECHELTTVDLSNNLKVRIGDEMFYTCSKLSKIVLPNNILEIGESAFYGCSSLKNIDIPDKVTEIGYSAFNNCSSLRSVTFEKGSQLKYMVEGVFCDCEALTSIEIPASVEMIDMYYCINLANIYCYPSIPPILNDFRCKNNNCMSPLRVLKHIKIVRGVNIIHQLKRYNNHNMQNNEHPSIERIFNLVEMQRHAVGVSFMPDTKSYEKYQTGVTVLHVLSMDLKTALQNMKNQFNTYGVIRVAGYDNSISPLKSKVIEIEFSTDEIDEIERK